MTAISILFSGGPDSTLAAIYALQKVHQVHLLTYHHKLMTHRKTESGEEKHMRVAKELSRIYGADRVIISKDQISNLLRRIYRNTTTHRGYCIPWICGACKLAMHIKTIEYNLRNKIKITYDGANKESASVFPAQSLVYIDIIKRLYRMYDMSYETPVYDLEKTDVLTEDFGLHSCRATKREHFFFSTQHSCFTGVLVHLHARFYRILYRSSRIDDLHRMVLETKISELGSLLPKT
jgi:7-cyano-7-deazaguanine synthase in queuosine biosynthesis